MDNEVRWRPLLVGSVWTCLGPQDRMPIRKVCRSWRKWEQVEMARDGVAHRPLSVDEAEEVLCRLRLLHMPWSRAIEDHLRRGLTSHPCTPTESPASLDALVDYLTRLYQRAVLPPKTNIGTLGLRLVWVEQGAGADTTRVIERLTQARLSRFHSTGTSGGAGIQQASSNLDTLLHPLQSTRRAQMIVHLCPRAVDVQSARAVLEHVRGRLIATTLGTFVCGRGDVVSLDPSSVTARLLGGVQHALRLPLDSDTVVWHGLDIVACVDRLGTNDDVTVTPVWEQEGVVIYAASRRVTELLARRPPDPWASSLPPLTEFLQEAWPAVADVFCAESCSVHGMMRVPPLSKTLVAEIASWDGIPAVNVAGEEEETRVLRESRRARRSRSAQAAGAKRRRGVRKWVVLSSDARRPVAPDPSVPAGLVQLVDWLLRALHQLSPRCLRAHLEGRGPEPWICAPRMRRLKSRGATGRGCP
jgi:hypothetical protein